MQQTLADFISNYSEWFYWLALSSIILLIVSILVIPIIIARIPADYFVTPTRRHKMEAFSFWKFLLRLIKNIIGIFLLICGIIMLITPGQGLLTILTGLFITDFPGKYHLERKLVQKPVILRTLNWIRRKQNVSEFQI